MKVIYKDDGSYTVAVETLFDSDLAEFEECGRGEPCRAKEDGDGR